MTIGEKIKQARKKANITQKQLGDKLGVSSVMISQYESDKRKPKYETLIKIADALDIKPGELIGYDYDLKFIKPRNSLKDILEKTIIIPDNMSEEVEKLLVNYSRLNDNGRKKAVEYTSDLTKIPEYRRYDPTD